MKVRDLLKVYNIQEPLAQNLILHEMNNYWSVTSDNKKKLIEEIGNREVVKITPLANNTTCIVEIELVND